MFTALKPEFLNAMVELQLRWREDKYPKCFARS